MSVSPEIVYLSFRVIGFICLLALLPRKLVPFSVFLVIGLVLFVFWLPLAAAGSALPEHALFRIALAPDSNLLPVLSSSLLINNFLVGVLFGTAAGFGGYLAQVVASWLSSLVFPERVENENDHLLTQSLASLEFLIALLLLLSVFEVVGFDRVFALLGKSFLLFPVAKLASLSSPSLMNLIAELGKVAFLTGFLVCLPLFLFSLMTDLVYLVANRFFSKGPALSTIASTRMLVVMFVFSLGMYASVDYISEGIELGVSGVFVREVLK